MKETANLSINFIGHDNHELDMVALYIYKSNYLYLYTHTHTNKHLVYCE